MKFILVFILAFLLAGCATSHLYPNDPGQVRLFMEAPSNQSGVHYLGTVHCRLPLSTPAEIQQAKALLQDKAAELGGSFAVVRKGNWQECVIVDPQGDWLYEPHPADASQPMLISAKVYLDTHYKHYFRF